MNRVLNWKKGPEDPRDFNSVRYLAVGSTPPKFELDRQLPIYDQLDIGSCTANMGAVCFRYELAQLVNNFDFLPSRLFLYYNTRLIEGTINEDAGAFIRDVFKALNKQGLCKEELHPYDTKKYALTPSGEAYKDGLNQVIVQYANVAQNLDVIKSTLVSGAAIGFGFHVYAGFFGNWSKTTGMMPLPTANEHLEGGHAVTIIGYDDAKQAVLIQNSWGTDWGLHGKFWMPYSYLLNARECSDFWCIETIQINTPTPPPEPSLDWETAAIVLFKNALELSILKKPTLVRLGQALKLDCSMQKTFKLNYDLVKQKLKL